MATMRDIKSRKESVTEYCSQITKAMKLVATVKTAKSQDKGMRIQSHILTICIIRLNPCLPKLGKYHIILTLNGR